jgi:hypothetical protein
VAQCEAASSTPGRPNFGQRCSRAAVTGSRFCSSHDGEKFSATPEKMRRQKDKPRVKCTATKRNGDPCNRWALKGASVCTSHGGNLPSIRESAREKLLALVLPAIEELEAVLSNPATANADKLRAIQLILDRTGYGTKSELEVTIKPWEATLKGIMRSAPTEYQPELPVLDAVVVDDDVDDLEEQFIRPAAPPRVVGSANPPVRPDLRRRD